MCLRYLYCLLLLAWCGSASALQISGTVYHDVNGNGARETGEGPLSGWVVYLDLNENGVRDAGEPLTTTDSNGNYVFTTGLSAMQYRVAVEPSPGWAVVNAAHPLKKLGNFTTNSYQYGDVWGEGTTAVIGGYETLAPITLLNIADPTHPTPTATWGDPPPPDFVLPAAHDCTTNTCGPSCTGGCGCGCSPLAWYASASTGYQYEYVILRNGIGYFGSNAGLGTSIVDCHDPAHPTTIVRFGAAQGASDFVHTLFLDGKYLYIADNRTTTVWVFDVSNPATPRKVRTIVAHANPAGVRVHQINVKNGRLFVAVNTLKNEEAVAPAGTVINESEVWDVSDIENSATWLGSWKSGYCTHTVTVTDDGNYGISAREPYPWEGAVGEVTIWDIHNPSNAQKVATLNATALGFGDCCCHIPVVSGNLLYVSWYWAGLKVFDITDPTHPTLVGHYHTSNMTTEFTGNWGVYLLPNSNTILASDMENGLVTLQPVLPGGHYTDLSFTPSVALDFAVRPPPAITSAVAAPTTGTTGIPVVFNAAVTTEDPLALLYTWDFGDAGTGSGAAPSHTYTVAGNYTVTVTATDSKGGHASTSFQLNIQNPAPPDAGGGTGSTGGNGGTDVTGGGAGPGSSGPIPTPMNITRISGALKFTVAGADSCTVQGVIPGVLTPFTPLSKPVLLDVSGASARFELNSRGSATSHSGSFALALKPYKTGGKPVKGEFSGGDIPFKAVLKKGAWMDIWKSIGVDASTTQPETLHFTVTLTLDGQVYSGTAAATLAAKANKGGTFK